MKPEKHRETGSGYHFYDLARKCERKFYLNYVLGIESKYTASPLILGGAFHEGKASFYLTGDKEKALEVCTTHIKKAQVEFYKEEDFAKVLTRCPIMLESWIDKHGYKDLETFSIIDVEKFVEVPLPETNYRITMRFDAVLQYKSSGNYILMETKSTQSSISNMINQVSIGDQATTYLWGFKKVYPERSLLGMVYDVTYWPKTSVNQKLIQHKRGFTDLIIRTKRDFAEWETGMNETISSISSKVDRVLNHGESEFIFERDTYWCYSYFKPCEYKPICRGCTIAPANPPDGFKMRDFPLQLTDECKE